MLRLKSDEQLPAGRLGWIDAAKGIGILLVVYGHAVDGLYAARMIDAASPLMTSFYAVYTFHMPLFFFLSGLLVERRVLRDRAGFVTRLLPSIVWPYVLWSIVQITIIHLAGAYVNNPLNGISAHTYLGIFWNPPSQFWFLYALLAFHLASAAMIRKALPAIHMVLLAAMLFQLPDLFGIHQRILEMLAHFFLYYALGVYFGQHITRLNEDFSRPVVAIAAALVFVVSVAAGFGRDVGYWAAPLLPAAVAGTVLILFLAVRLRGTATAALQYIGQRAMAIYVLHVLFVAGTRIVVIRLTGIENPAALAVLLTCIGVAAPLAIVALTDRLGLSSRLGLGGAPVPKRRPAYG